MFTYLLENQFAWSLLNRKKFNLLDNLSTLFNFQKQRIYHHFDIPGAESKLNEVILSSYSSRSHSTTDIVDDIHTTKMTDSISTESDTQTQLIEFEKAIQLSKALYENPSLEIDSLLNGLSGGFIPAAPGGDIIRDGINVLPTGRNIYALDPYRIPSDVAMIRGKQAAELILKAHREANNGAYPETVAVTLWGLDAIKTKVINNNNI